MDLRQELSSWIIDRNNYHDEFGGEVDRRDVGRTVFIVFIDSA